MTLYEASMAMIDFMEEMDKMISRVALVMILSMQATVMIILKETKALTR